MKRGLPALLLLCSVFPALSGLSQNINPDSVQHEEALSNAIQIYKNQLGDQSPLFNGSLYAEYPYTFKSGTPFFPSENFVTGWVVYDGLRFDSVSLLYDDLRQLLVYRKNAYLLQLVNPRISAFNIDGHQFVRMEAGNSNPGIAVTGFYEILYPGRTEVLKITNKNIQEQASITEGMIHFIESSDVYYVKSGNQYIRVKSKNEMLAIFKGYEKDVQKYLKKNKLNFRKNTNHTLIQAAGYYDQIAK